MKKVATSYKGKHFIIEDEDSDTDGIDPYIDVEKVISNDTLLRSHVEDCRYYGIPAYLGQDEALNARIEAINKEVDAEETPHKEESHHDY